MDKNDLKAAAIKLGEQVKEAVGDDYHVNDDSFVEATEDVMEHFEAEVLDVVGVAPTDLMDFAYGMVHNPHFAHAMLHIPPVALQSSLFCNGFTFACFLMKMQGQGKLEDLDSDMLAKELDEFLETLPDFNDGTTTTEEKEEAPPDDSDLEE